MVALDVERLMRECDCTVAGPVSNVEEALEIVRQVRLDGAVLDINLGDEWVWPVASLLAERRVPFLLATGYDTSQVPEQFRSAPLLSKPLTRESLGRALRQIGTTSAR